MIATKEKDNFYRQKELLPFLLPSNKIERKEASKLDSFEKGLASEIKKTDTIEMAVGKIVKMSLLSEFGAGLLASSGAKGMIDTITYGILHDSELRKQALLIIDRFAS